MRVFLQIAYFIMGIVQFFAAWDGFIHLLGIGSFLGFILAFFTAYIPLVGSAAGMYGAITVWGWGVLQAFILFFWYLVVFAIVLAIGGVQSLRPN